MDQTRDITTVAADNQARKRRRHSRFHVSARLLSILVAVMMVVLGMPMAPISAASETIGNETGTTQSTDVYWFGQTFTPVNRISVSSIELYMNSGSNGSSSRNVVIQIRTVSGGIPVMTAAGLMGTSDSLSVNTSAGWKVFTFGTAVTLNAGTMYSVIISSASGDLDYFYNTSNSAYSNGTRLTSNFGTSWTSSSGDLRFRIINTIVDAVTVNFDKNGGETEANPTTRGTTSGGTVTLPTPPTWTGHTFTGWNTQANGLGTAFTAATSVTASITVYAQWTINQYTVTFNKNGGTVDAIPASIVTDFNTTVTLPVPPTRPGFTFAGWNTASDGSGTLFTSSTLVTGDITVHAQWTDDSILPDGSVIIGKTASPFDTYAMSNPFDIASILAGHRKTTITLDVSALPLRKPVDIVIVLDISNSMDDTATKLADMKTAAITLAQRIIDANPVNRVALVTYKSDAFAYNFGTSSGWVGVFSLTGTGGQTFFSGNKATINAAINALSITGGQDGGTNTEGGFLAADKVMELQGRTDADFLALSPLNGTRVIAFMTDGVPTFRYNGTTSTSDDDGSRSSVAELNEAIAAGVAAKIQTKVVGSGTVDGPVKIFTIGLIEGLTSFQIQVAQLLLHNQATVNSINWTNGTMSTTANAALDYEFKYFETTDSSMLDDIYYTISGLIEPVATSGVVTDIVSAEWTLDSDSFKIGGVSVPAGQVAVDPADPATNPASIVVVHHADGTTTILWKVGDIYPAGTSLTYTLAGKPTIFGVADTNDEAVLTFNHVMSVPPAGSSSPMVFPIPEAELNAFTVDDFYGVDWNGSVTFDVRTNDPSANTAVNESGFDVPEILEMTPITGSLTYSRPDVSGTLDYNPTTGAFAFTPNAVMVDSDYTVTFPYYLSKTTGTGDTTLVMKSEPALVTITVNHYTAFGSVVLEADKVLAGRLLKNGEFNFDLKQGTTVLDSKTNDADGNVVFKALNYTQADIGATYTYTIVEIPGSETDMTYDPMVITVTVTVADAGNGVLTVTPSYPADVVFNNSYVAKGSVVLEADKALSGRLLKDGEFSFNLRQGSTVLDTKTNDADGNVIFKALNYTQADIGATYTYTIVEIPGVENDMTYDPMVITVTVTVVDAGNGVLTVTPSYPADVVFDNSYVAKGSVVLEADKLLTGRLLKNGEFNFDLKQGTTVLQSKTNDIDGDITFNALNYTQADIGQVYTYTIVEVPGSETDMTYDPMVITVMVTVVDAGDGVLTVTPSYSTDVIFNNRYVAKGSVVLEADKLLAGRLLKDGEFNFNLKQGTTVLQSKVNDSDGNVIFDALNYTQADIGATYTYTIVEVPGAETGMTYDPMTITVSVSVTDAGNGVLTVTPSYSADVLFNNSYVAKGSVVLKADKLLAGRLLKSGEFNFDLKQGTTVLQSKTNESDGDILFDALNYTQADIGATYTYTIVEVAGSETDMTYDPMVITMTVTVVDAGNGVLTVTPSYSADVVFNNSYVAKGSVVLEADKVLAGRQLKSGEFRFDLKQGTTVLQSKTNESDGDIIFDALNYTQADIGATYTYTIVEVPGAETNMNYDPMTITVTVTVVDAGNGVLTVTPSYSADVVFDNSYTAKGSVVLEADKVLAGRLLKDGEFSFNLRQGSTVLQTKTNVLDGSITFDALNYTQADIGQTYTYTIVEIPGSENDMTYDPMVITVTVAVVDAGNGVLTVTPSYSDDVVFDNSYVAKGSVVLEADKVLAGRLLKNGEFNFDLKQGTTVLQSKANALDGSITFDALNYTQADIGQTYTYTIVEIPGVENDMTYDPMVITVTVTVVDAGNGVLTVTPSYSADVVFNNSYVAKGSVVLEADKILTGRLLKNGEFSFDLKQGTTVLQSKTNDADGNVIFDVLNYTQSDIGATYTYTIVEIPGTETDMTYDPMVITVTVAIVDAGNGVLTVTPSYSADVVFNNSYVAKGSVVLEADKVLAGRLLKNGEFNFDLKQGTTVLQSKTNDADGNVIFTALDYTQSDIGQTYTYTIVEVAGSETDMTYDPMTITVTVTIADAGNGVLTVTPSYSADVIFDNSYVAKGSVVLEADKLLVGRLLKNGEFTFDLKQGTTVLQSKTNDVDGNVIFTALDYTQADIGETYTYTIVEVPGAETDMDYDPMTITVTVTIVDAGNGVLTVTPSYSDDVIFDNSYTAKGSVVLEADKVLAGRVLKNGEFSFNLRQGSTVLQTKTNALDGSITFDALNYTQADIGETYTYTIVEIPGAENDMTYDPMVITVTVAIVDAGNGALTVTPSYSDDVVFDNSYVATGSVILTADKLLTGRLLKNGEFNFDLMQDTTVLQSKTNEVDGSITFDALSYTQADIGATYTYTIVEVAGSETDMTYDPLVITVTVTVVDAGDGVLTVTPSYSDAAVFNNSYVAVGSVVLAADKVLTGRTLTNGEFNFDLKQGTTVLQSKTNELDGSITFDTLNYTQADIGQMYTYTIVEVAGNETGMLYDPMTITVNVSVTDAGNGVLTVVPEYMGDATFHNLYQAPAIDLVKVAQNLTTGGAAIDGSLVASVINDTIQYTITVTNPGNMTLYDAILTDDLVSADTAATIDGVSAVWMAGATGESAFLDLGDLEPGATVVITYQYTITSSDAVAGIRINTAEVVANALMAETIPTQETPVGTYIQELVANDTAIVTATDIPLSGTPLLNLSKTVRNKTAGGTFGEVTGGNPGDVFEYRLIVMNNGDVALSGVQVHDDHALIGGNVILNGVTRTWSAGTDGKAMLNVGDLAVGAYVTLTYEYTSVDADDKVARVNTAVSDATVTMTIPNPVPVKIASNIDTAMLLVEKIPETGEPSSTTSYTGGAMILAVGAAGVALIRYRRKDEILDEPEE